MDRTSNCRFVQNSNCAFTKHVVAIFEAAIALHDGVSLADTAAAAAEASLVVEQLLAKAAAVVAVKWRRR
jgi:hypothetical protein